MNSDVSSDRIQSVDKALTSVIALLEHEQTLKKVLSPPHYSHQH